MRRLASRLPTLISRIPPLRAPLRLLHKYAIRGRPSMKKHPFDLRMGISAEGYLPWWLLRSDTQADQQNSGYAGCQPSCLRRALTTIPSPERFVFVDIGCGKGRSMAVASEFPFRRIVGIEIAPALVRIALRNIGVLRGRFPDRPAIEVIEGDATRMPLPEGDMVVFLYQPFSRTMMQQLLATLTRSRGGDDIFVVYENPLEADLFDAVPGLKRWQAETVPCDPEERGLAPLDQESIVTWRWSAPPLG